MGKFIVITFIACLPLILHAQEECRAKGNDIYGTIVLREYNLNKIDKGFEPSYQRDLPKGDYVDILELRNGYAIVIYRNDTFSIETKYLQSDCLSDRLQRIEQEKEKQKKIDREKEKQYWSKFLKQKTLMQEQEKLIWKDSLKKGTVNINNISPSIVRINDLAILYEINRDKKVFLHSKDSVELVGYKNDTAYVFHEGRLYHTILKDLISPIADSLMVIFNEQEAQKERDRAIAHEKEIQKKKAANIAARNKRKALLIDKYGESIANLILSHKVHIGMTKDMARESWGRPQDINRTITQFGTHEQWVYGNGNYLYFDDDRLTTIQN